MYRLREIDVSEHNTFDFYRSVMPDCLTLNLIHETMYSSLRGATNLSRHSEPVDTTAYIVSAYPDFYLVSVGRGWFPGKRLALAQGRGRDFSFQQNGSRKCNEHFTPEPNAKRTSAMTDNTPTTLTQQDEQYFCVCCGSPVLIAEQEDYRIGYEGTTYLLLTCPQSPSKCKIGQATASLRRVENGEFQMQWQVNDQYDLHTGKAK